MTLGVDRDTVQVLSLMIVVFNYSCGSELNRQSQ